MREIDKKNAQIRAGLAEQARKIAEARHKGIALEVDELRESRGKLTKGVAAVLQAEHARAVAMVDNLGLDLSRDQADEMVAMLAEKAEAMWADVTRGVESLAVTIEREEKIREHRERQVAQRARAVRAGIPERDMRAIQAAWIQPGDAASANDDREREVVRERDRVVGRDRQRTLGREPD
ncbi:hypothetical protein ACLMAJ_33395 [Nocardia sp. KC 131]|uniref:hypothetical protein n=1 Tax=Nocardia arseniciresistens TaxID=3392119 RepID=UPI00398F6A84